MDWADDLAVSICSNTGIIERERAIASALRAAEARGIERALAVLDAPYAHLTEEQRDALQAKQDGEVGELANKSEPLRYIIAYSMQHARHGMIATARSGIRALIPATPTGGKNDG